MSISAFLRGSDLPGMATLLFCLDFALQQRWAQRVAEKNRSPGTYLTTDAAFCAGLLRFLPKAKRISENCLQSIVKNCSFSRR